MTQLEKARREIARNEMLARRAELIQRQADFDKQLNTLKQIDIRVLNFRYKFPQLVDN